MRRNKVRKVEPTLLHRQIWFPCHSQQSRDLVLQLQSTTSWFWIDRGHLQCLLKLTSYLRSILPMIEKQLCVVVSSTASTSSAIVIDCAIVKYMLSIVKSISIVLSPFYWDKLQSTKQFSPKKLNCSCRKHHHSCRTWKVSRI